MRIAAAVVEAPGASVAPVEEQKKSVEAPTEQQKMEELYEHTESRGGKIKADSLKIIMFQVLGNSSFSTKRNTSINCQPVCDFFFLLFFVFCFVHAAVAPSNESIV
jgi:hypothetical protein